MVVMSYFLPQKRRWLFNILTCKENLLQFIVFTYVLYSTLNDQLEISVRTTKINGLPYFLWFTLVWAKPGVVCLQICFANCLGPVWMFQIVLLRCFSTVSKRHQKILHVKSLKTLYKIEYVKTIIMANT